MHDSESIVAFLNPLEVAPGITDFPTLRAVMKGHALRTLLPQDFFRAARVALPAARDVLARGDWVQAGVWKGGGALFLRALMREMGIEKSLHLFDTFGCFPVACFSHEKDRIFVRELGLQASAMPQVSYRDSVDNLFADFGMTDGVRLHEFDIRAVPENQIPGEIAFLHVDLDFYEPTFSALEIFYDRMIPGGIAIIDDYYLDLLNCREAVDDFLVIRGIDPRRQLSRFSSYSAQLIKPVTGP